MKIRENGRRPFDNSAVRKQYSAENISANDFPAIRRNGLFIYQPNARRNKLSTLFEFRFRAYIYRYYLLFCVHLQTELSTAIAVNFLR